MAGPVSSYGVTQVSHANGQAAAIPDGLLTLDTLGKSRKRKRVRIPRLQKWTPVIVTWIDAVTFEEQRDSNKHDFSCPVRKSIGFFIKRTVTEFTIAMEDDREGEIEGADCQTVTSIPFGMLKEVVKLKPE